MFQGLHLALVGGQAQLVHAGARGEDREGVGGAGNGVIRTEPSIASQATANRFDATPSIAADGAPGARLAADDRDDPSRVSSRVRVWPHE